ncbi:glycosyltransferase family 9 protein [Sediminicola sp. 1XM1-17]|uniref:glycosyltransferase family 9 protein n=1 Tax=Sediminicola sp. 1XM1-17 TaxID=3127702 RepID=UPI00307807C2
MGDVAMTVPVLSGLVHQYPNVKVTVLTRGFFAPLFQGIPNVVVYAADVKGKHKGVLGLYKLFKELTTLQIDAVADLHYVLRSSILKTFFRLTNIPFVQIDKGRAGKKALTAHTNKVFRPLQSTHQRYADVFAVLGFPIDLESVAPASQSEISATIEKVVGPKTEKWIGIAPFAAFEGKMYPLSQMRKVVKALCENKDFKILLFGGGKKEEQQLDIWAVEFKNCVNMAGKIAFEEELTVISQLDLMVAMDSGNAHLAAIYGIPTITFWGVTHPYAGFYPFGQDPNNALLADREQYPLIPTSVYGNKFPKGYESVMETIAPEAVIDKINAVLNRR